MTRGRRATGWLIATLILAVSPTPATAAPTQGAASQTPSAPARLARLQGRFLLLGTATVAVDVRGERVGEQALRTWDFTPLCPTGACAAVRLTRGRANGVDILVLRRRARAFYVGRGSFYAPLRCGRRIHPLGQRVRFKITVRVTEATSVNGVVIATRVRASYTNRARINLTPCVAALGHDAASYRGHLVGA